MEYTEGEQCVARVSHDDWGHMHQCPRKAVVERDSKPFCKIHDPEYVKAKRETREKETENKWVERRACLELQNTAVRACKEINPDNPMAVAESIPELYEAVIGLMEIAEIAMPDTFFLSDSRTNKAREALAKVEAR